jgi:hypothetical protein
VTSTKGTVTITGARTIKISGVTLTATATFTVTYGAPTHQATSPNPAVATLPKTYTFTTKQEPIATGTLTALAASPVVKVKNTSVITQTTCNISQTTNTHKITPGCAVTSTKQVHAIALYAPSGIKAGNVLIAQVSARVATPSGLTAPAGWTKVTSASVTGHGTIFMGVFYCVVTKGTGCKTSQASWTWTWSTAATKVADTSGAIMQFTNVTPTNPIDVAATNFGSTNGWTTATSPSVTPTHAGDLVIGLLSSGGGQHFTTMTCKLTATTMSRYFDVRSTNTTVFNGSVNALESASVGCSAKAVQAGTAATGKITYTQTTGANNQFAWNAATIALRWG